MDGVDFLGDTRASVILRSEAMTSSIVLLYFLRFPNSELIRLGSADETNFASAFERSAAKAAWIVVQNTTASVVIDFFMMIDFVLRAERVGDALGDD
ncbi:MAG: hypothetical protein CFE23_16115 [Flavobacterium sp. BFFFF1]|nr:MAG: hypothetical protein CFE23_16115 [Flavobacterium sp. BFFFF1]